MLAAPYTESNSDLAKDKVWSGPQITIDDWGITRLTQSGQVSPREKQITAHYGIAAERGAWVHVNLLTRI